MTEFSWLFSPLLYPVRAKKKWAIKVYLGKASSISKLVAAEGNQLRS